MSTLAFVVRREVTLLGAWLCSASSVFFTSSGFVSFFGGSWNWMATVDPADPDSPFVCCFFLSSVLLSALAFGAFSAY